MDEVESVGVGSENGGKEVETVIDEIGNVAKRLMGRVVLTLVIGAPISDTLTTVSKIGTSSEPDLVVTISSGMDSGVVVEICEVGVIETSGRETVTSVETGGVSGTISSSEDSLRMIIFRFFKSFCCICFATS